MGYARKRHKLQNAQAFRIPDVGRAYNIGITSIRAAIKSGELEASKLGSKPRSPVVVTRAAVERWLDRCRVKPTA